MVSRSALYKECSELMKNCGTDDAEYDAMCIFQDVLGEKNPLFRPLEAVEERDEQLIRIMTKRRCSGEPLQYILGEWEFYGYPFKVGKGVLIPRPDTETLIEQVLDICRSEHLEAPQIADLCAGSGCIAVTLKKQLPNAEITAVELSDAAMDYLKQNVSLNSADIRIIKGDVLSPETAALFGDMDIIVSNPPYLTQEDMDTLQEEVTHEPSSALFGGGDGLDFYRRMTPLWKTTLKNNGWLCYEFGMGQHDDVKNILAGNGFKNITLRRDLGGIIRTAAAQIQEDK